MKKHGFTLIEIIICIILITTISVGTTIVVIKNNEKKEQNTLKKYENIFDNALEVYLSNHEEITTNLNNYAKAAAVTLEVLKNDGLISDDLDIDYKNNYYLLSNAQLLNNGETTNVDCDSDSDVVGIEIFKKWDLSEYEDGKKVIYVCPTNDSSSTEDNSKVGIDELEKRISALEKMGGNTKNIFTGDNVNNYVYFNVDDSNANSSMAYWPSENKNLWRIYSYYGTDGSSSNIKLVYSQPATINTNYITVTKKEISFNSFIDKTSGKTIEGITKAHSTNCTYNNSYVYILNDEYYKYEGCSGKCKRQNYYVSKISTVVSDYLPDTFTCTSDPIKYNKNQFDVTLDSNYLYPTDSVKNHLYQKIKYKDWIEAYPYYTTYTGTNRIDAKLTYSNVVYDKIGVITQNEFLETISASKTWMKYYTECFVGKLNYSFDTYMVKLLTDSTINTINTDDDPSADLVPVVTLKSGVKIISDESCGTPGSKNCPYKLSFEGKTTDNT